LQANANAHDMFQGKMRLRGKTTHDSPILILLAPQLNSQDIFLISISNFI